jgi:hypothetical protein
LQNCKSTHSREKVFFLSGAQTNKIVGGAKVCNFMEIPKLVQAELAALRAQVAAQATALDAAQRGLASGLRDGARVRVAGLVTAPQFNGCYGTVIAFDNITGRYIVTLEGASGGRPKSFRLAHITAVQAVQAAAAPPPPLAPLKPAYEDEVEEVEDAAAAAVIAQALREAEEEVDQEDAAGVIDLTQGDDEDEDEDEDDFDDEEDAVEVIAPPSKKRRKATTNSGGGGGGSCGSAVSSKKKPAGGRKKALPRPTAAVYMHEDDIPVAPGPIVEDPLPGARGSSSAATAAASSSSSSSASSKSETNKTGAKKLIALKARIGKMLERGLHPNTPEVEAQRCMRLAQKMLAKHNLTQASIMADVGELRDEGALQGGIVPTFLRTIPKKGAIATKLSSAHWQKAQMPRWADDLAGVVCSNFATKRYVVKSRGKVCFYGLKINAQLSGYAFKTAFARIHQMAKVFAVPHGEFERKRAWGTTRVKSKGSYTAQARLHYCAGLVAGLRVAVREAKARRLRRREARMRRWQATLAKLEGAPAAAAASSSSASSSSASASASACADNDNSNGSSLWDAGWSPSGSDSDLDDDGVKGSSSGGGADSTVKSENTKLVVEAKLEKIKVKIAKMTKEDRLTDSIVVHTTSVEDAALKKADIKLTKGGKYLHPLHALSF